jgi:hypothetical protein
MLTVLRAASVIRPYHNFAPFVRQTGEKKAQACAMGILQQLPARTGVSVSSLSNAAASHAQESRSAARANLLNKGIRHVLKSR